VFQLGDALAKRLLGDVQPTGGTGEAELLGDNYESPECLWARKLTIGCVISALLALMSGRARWV
jgi:hypothetical protein